MLIDSAFWRTTFLLILLCSLGYADFSEPQLPDRATPAVVEGLQKEFRSAQWQHREKAFHELLHLADGRDLGGETHEASPALNRLLATDPTHADAVKLSLIELLEAENGVVAHQEEEFARSGERISEEYSDYYGDLIAVVSGLRDPRSIPALAGAICTGGMASDTLVFFGRDAVGAVVERASASSERSRSCAVGLLGGFLNPAGSVHPVGDSASRNLIEAHLLQAASDADPNVRRAAIAGLAYFGDDEARKAIEKAATDPFMFTMAGKTIYPVRESARWSIQLSGLVREVDRLRSGKQNDVSPESRKRSKQLFLEASRSLVPAQRVLAVDGLGLLRDSDSIPTLRSISEMDAFVLPHANADGSDYYPVRAAAISALSLMKSPGLDHAR